jgi:response regulator of citrate/malate metabolism
MKQLLKVLLVEDDFAMESYWSYVLQKKYSPSLKIDWVHDEQEATALIEVSEDDKAPYDLIIVDIYLEGARTGLDLWSRYKDTLGSKMIVISSIEENRIFELLQGEDVPIYLQKPLNAKLCRDTVDYILAH